MQEGGETEKKTSGKWKKTEHDRFMKGLQKHGRNWVEIQKCVKSRTVAQVRSHAQKLFLSMSEHEIRAYEAEDARREADFCKGKGINRGKETLQKQLEEEKIKVEQLLQEEQSQKKEEEMIKIENQNIPSPPINNIGNGNGEYFNQDNPDYMYQIPVYNLGAMGGNYPMISQVNIMTLPMFVNPCLLKELVEDENEENNSKLKQ